MYKSCMIDTIPTTWTLLQLHHFYMVYNIDWTHYHSTVLPVCIVPLYSYNSGNGF